MSSETNKLLCAILTAFLFFLLTSFIGDLVYHYEKKTKTLSYFLEEEDKKDFLTADVKNETVVISKQEIESKLALADIQAGEKFAKKNCGTCHEFNLPEKNKIGPSLALLFNRKIAAVANYKYSKALKDKSGVWDSENLYFFLEKPKEWVPGTKMSYKGIKKSQDLVNLIMYVSENTSQNEN